MVLADGEDLLGVPDELEAYEVFVDHFEDIHLEGSDGIPDPDEARRLVDRLRVWFGRPNCALVGADGRLWAGHPTCPTAVVRRSEHNSPSVGSREQSPRRKEQDGQ